MSMIIDGTNGLTFNNATTQASAGQVLQVVNATYATQVSNNTQTPADTGLTATITPKFSTSKILVLVMQSSSAYAQVTARTDVGFCIYLQRNGTTIFNGSLNPSLYFYSATVGNYQISGNIPINYLDSPATTSAVTYKTQSFCLNAGANTYANSSNQPSTITLLEIAQ